jgi:hypothetical protein
MEKDGEREEKKNYSTAALFSLNLMRNRGA